MILAIMAKKVMLTIRKDDDIECYAIPQSVYRQVSELVEKWKAGALLKQAREREGLTQEQLADKLSTSQTAIAAMESGGRPVSEGMLSRLKKAGIEL
jgi:ribosome-binding protein aMBF1 (putative translation factor)